jgi:hypothetical protein
MTQRVPDRPVVLVHRQFPGAYRRKRHSGRVSGPSGVVACRQTCLQQCRPDFGVSDAPTGLFTVCSGRQDWTKIDDPKLNFGRAESLGLNTSGSKHRTPLPYILDTRSVGLLYRRPDTKCVPVRAFSDHKPIRFLDCQSSRKVLLGQLGATALRATCGVRVRELRAGGRSAPSPWLLSGGVHSSSRLQYKRLAVSAALRRLPVIPNSRHSPLKMGPRGSRAAGLTSHKHTPARTSRGTN